MEFGKSDPRTQLRQLVWIISGDGRPQLEDCAGGMLAEFGSIGAILAASYDRQLKAAGGDESIVVNLRTCRDLIAEVLKLRMAKGTLLSDCPKLHDYLYATLAYGPVERFRVLYLDVDKRLIRDDLLGVGTVDRVALYPREVIRGAIDVGATALILVHNHPSGRSMPSPSDIGLTRRIASIAAELEIDLLDHLVVSTAGVVSLRQLGVLK